MLTVRRKELSGHALLVFGWITLAFWASMAFFPQRLPPLTLTDSFQDDRYPT